MARDSAESQVGLTLVGVLHSFASLDFVHDIDLEHASFWASSPMRPWMRSWNPREFYVYIDMREVETDAAELIEEAVSEGYMDRFAPSAEGAYRLLGEKLEEAVISAFPETSKLEYRDMYFRAMPGESRQ